MAREVARRILAHGTIDWVHMPEVDAIARAMGVDDDETARLVCVGAIHQLLQEGLVRAGTVLADGGFRPWSGLAPLEASERIDREWIRLGQPRVPGEICWLENTVAGARRGAAEREDLLRTQTWRAPKG